MRTGNKPLFSLGCLTLLAALAAPSAVRAGEPALPLVPTIAPLGESVAAPMALDELRGDMRRYFREEKRGGAVLMGLGLPGVALGGGLLAHGSDTLRGFAYPLLIIGALEFVGGLIFYLRTSKQVAKLDAGLVNDTWATRNLELRRIRRINLQFTLIEALELTLLVGGVVMAATGAGTRNETLTGVGLGLGLESAGLLIFDLYAGRRALRWTRSLERFHSSAGATP
jgi:hypothetical protein